MIDALTLIILVFLTAIVLYGLYLSIQRRR